VYEPSIICIKLLLRSLGVELRQDGPESTAAHIFVPGNDVNQGFSYISSFYALTGIILYCTVTGLQLKLANFIVSEAYCKNYWNLSYSHGRRLDLIRVHATHVIVVRTDPLGTPGPTGIRCCRYI
jgi:hypothetical protein